MARLFVAPVEIPGSAHGFAPWVWIGPLPETDAEPVRAVRGAGVRRRGGGIERPRSPSGQPVCTSRASRWEDPVNDTGAIPDQEVHCHAVS